MPDTEEEGVEETCCAADVHIILSRNGLGETLPWVEGCVTGTKRPRFELVSSIRGVEWTVVGTRDWVR